MLTNTTMSLRGAIKITPMLNQAQTDRLNQFFKMRHAKRDVEMLKILYPTKERRKAVSLFGNGDFGKDGELYIPPKTLKTISGGTDSLVDAVSFPGDKDTIPDECPSLYSNLIVVPSEDKTCSYIGWNGGSEPEKVKDWLEWLTAHLIASQGCNLCGSMVVNINDGDEFRIINVKAAVVWDEPMPLPATYEREFRSACTEASLKEFRKQYSIK